MGCNAHVQIAKTTGSRELNGNSREINMEDIWNLRKIGGRILPYLFAGEKI